MLRESSTDLRQCRTVLLHPLTQKAWRISLSIARVVAAAWSKYSWVIGDHRNQNGRGFTFERAHPSVVAALASPIELQHTIAHFRPLSQRVFIPPSLHGDDFIRTLFEEFNNPLWPYVFFR